MRRAYPVLLTTLLVTSTGFGQIAPKSPGPSPKTEKCSVAGMVVRKGSNEPIHFARVTLTSDGEEPKSVHGTRRKIFV